MARGIEVHNGKVVLGDIVSLNISRTYKAGEALTGVVSGARMYLRDDESDPVTLGDFYGLYILDMISATPSAESAMLRLELNALIASTRTSVISVPVSTLGDFNYLLYVNPAHKTAWDSAGDKTQSPYGVNGWLKISVGGVDRWIQLYALV